MLGQKDEDSSSLKTELNELKEINVQWSGEKVALQTRLSQQEQVILALKFKLLQYEISTKNKTEEEMDCVVEEHQRQVQQLRGELAMKNDIIHKQKLDLAELNSELQSRSEVEASLQSKLETQESKVSNLQKQLHEQSAERIHSSTLAEKLREEASTSIISGKLNESKFHRDTQKILREHKNMCTTLCNIRQKFKTEDPVHHTFESMEQRIAENHSAVDETKCKSRVQSMTSLVDTLSMMETTMQTKESHNRMVSIPKLCTMNMNNSTCSSDSGYDNYVPSDPGERLKVIYYLGKSMTPVLKISDIGLGSFTLRDFKQAVNRPGKYRYFFKSVDSDFGYVREELLFDDDIVPGHDNKVVAWLEKSVTDL